VCVALLQKALGNFERTVTSSSAAVCRRLPLTPPPLILLACGGNSLQLQEAAVDLELHGGVEVDLALRVLHGIVVPATDASSGMWTSAGTLWASRPVIQSYDDNEHNQAAQQYLG
jgi:hypothetical protein